MARELTNGLADSSALNAAAVTPSDSADLANAARMIYVGTTGHVKLTTLKGDTVVLNSVPVGLHRITAARIWSTGTTASNIVALW